MSRIKAIIYTSSDNTNDLVFENEDILAISTNTKCIENENLPEFDIFPNSGTLTVKDRNLDIYNKAINGIFDNYEYKVEYYLENEIIATHIINQRPKYDYDAKTCTFYLGNSLDKLANQTFEAYDYPLESQTLYTIFKEVLKRIFNIDEDEYEDEYKRLMDGVFGDYKVGETTYSNLTFENYFKSINITYPYISQTNSREALKTILLIAQCGMYLDKNNKLKLIRLDGYSNANADEYYNNVYKIEPRHMNKGFVPSVILDNKFNKFNLDRYIIETKITNNDDIYIFVENNENLYNTLTKINQENIEDDEQLKDTAVLIDYDVDIGSKTLSDWFIFALTKQNVLDYSFYNAGWLIDILYNNNLNEILNVNNAMGKNSNEELEITNPSINLIYERKINQTKGYFTNLQDKNNLVDLADAKDWVFEDVQKNAVETIENISLFPLNNIDENNYNFKIDVVNKTLNCSTNIDRKNYSTIKKQTSTYRGEINILAEKTIDYYYGLFLKNTAEIPNSSSSLDREEFDYLESDNFLEHITRIRTKYILKQIEITYKGITKKITFENDSFIKGNNYSYTLQSNLELNQNTSFFNDNNAQEAMLNNLLNTFNGGLHTGTLTVANTNYNFVNPKYETITQNILFLGKEKSYNGMFVSSIDFNQSFNIMVDEINGIELSDSFKKIEVEDAPNVWINGVNTTIGYEIQAKKDTTKNQIIVKIYFYPRQNINNFSFSNFSLTGTIKKLINTNKKLFEIGDKVMPFKDKPIINRVVEGVEEPVVFQIVDCETFNESGATFQNLVLREIKKPTT